MQIQLSADAEELLKKQIARDGFATADEAIEQALRFYEAHRPTMKSLKAKLQEGLDDVAAGRVGPLDIDDIEQRGREPFITRLREAHESYEAGDMALLDADEIKRRGRERMAKLKPPGDA